MEIKSFHPIDSSSPRTLQKSPIKNIQIQQEYDSCLRDRSSSAIPDLSRSKIEKEVPSQALNRSNSAVNLSPGSKQSPAKLNPKPKKVRIQRPSSDSEEETSTLQNSVYLPETDEGTEKSL